MIVYRMSNPMTDHAFVRLLDLWDLFALWYLPPFFTELSLKESVMSIGNKSNSQTGKLVNRRVTVYVFVVIRSWKLYVVCIWASKSYFCTHLESIGKNFRIVIKSTIYSLFQTKLHLNICCYFLKGTVFISLNLSILFLFANECPA